MNDDLPPPFYPACPRCLQTLRPYIRWQGGVAIELGYYCPTGRGGGDHACGVRARRAPWRVLGPPAES